MRVATKRKDGRLPNGAIKIGTVARRFSVSPDLLRLYERQGLLIPLKSPRGTRYFTEHDFPWIEMLLRLVREARLNLAGIRHLLALIPCWQQRNCPFDRRLDCPQIQDPAQPCWLNRACAPDLDAPDCYFCPVYRSAPQNETLRALLGPHEPAAARV
jgi:MerR family transcriptional regulator, heat shock protein HspR